MKGRLTGESFSTCRNWMTGWDRMNLYRMNLGFLEGQGFTMAWDCSYAIMLLRQKLVVDFINDGSNF